MDLPMNVLVVLALVVLVLIVLSAFFFGQSGQQMTEAEANKIFNLNCENYRNANCQWRVTRSDSFGEFLQACHVLYGPNQHEFSCLYDFCCGFSGDVSCQGFCSLCRGNKYAGLPADSINNCLDVYSNKCEGTCVV
jgi:hypothetical protein